MKKEIDLELDLSVSKSVLLDHHSLLNMLNVLQYELDALLSKTNNSAISRHKDFVVDLLLTLSKKKLDSRINEIEGEFFLFAQDLKKFRFENKEFKNQADILLDILETAVLRLEEFKTDRFEWKKIPGSEIKSSLVSFLDVVEKVSRHRFNFVYPPEEPGISDYLIVLDIDDNPGALYAPLIIQDTIRDLVANSRKYSKAGSRIVIRLSQIERNGIKLVITDEGMGIPENEISNVVKFNQRASNVKEIRSMGKGFGLTKAYHICKLFNGKFVISSKVEEGTMIELTMYPPEVNGRPV